MITGVSPQKNTPNLPIPRAEPKSHLPNPPSLPPFANPVFYPEGQTVLRRVLKLVGLAAGVVGSKKYMACQIGI